MPALPPDRSFLAAAAGGLLLTLAAAVLAAGGAGDSDAASLLLGAMIAGIAISIFSLVAPAARMLVGGWRSVGIAPRDPRAARRLADGITIAVWLLWLAGAAATLPRAWAPMLAYLARR